MRWIIFGVVLVLLVLVIVGGYKNNEVPSELGVENGKLAKLPASPNAVSSQTEVEDKYVEPLAFKTDLATSYQQILSILEQDPSIEILKQQDAYIHAVASTEGIGFKDDLEFYFDRESQVIHYRSASRVGYSDFGKNRARYNEIKKKY